MKELSIMRKDGGMTENRSGPLTKPMLVDGRCHKLAVYFLRDVADREQRVIPREAVDSLARAIQQAVEEWFQIPDEDKP